MTRGAHHLAQNMAQGAADLAGALARRGARVGLACVLALVGLGFVIGAGFATLRLAVGPEAAAFLTGAILIALAILPAGPPQMPGWFAGIGASAPPP